MSGKWFILKYNIKVQQFCDDTYVSNCCTPFEYYVLINTINLVLIWWLGSCRRSRRYVWPAATSVIWGTSCSWARGFMTDSRATLPHRRSSTLTPPPTEGLTNQLSQSTSVLSASATKGKWWADDNYKLASKKKVQIKKNPVYTGVRAPTQQCYYYYSIIMYNFWWSLCDLSNYNKYFNNNYN